MQIYRYMLFPPQFSSVSVSVSALQSGTSAGEVTNGQLANIVEILGEVTAEAYARALPCHDAGEGKEELHRARFAACKGFIANGRFDDWLSEEHIMGLLTLRGRMDGGPPSHTPAHTHCTHTCTWLGLLVDESPTLSLQRQRAGDNTATAGWKLGGTFDAHARARGPTTQPHTHSMAQPSLGPVALPRRSAPSLRRPALVRWWPWFERQRAGDNTATAGWKLGGTFDAHARARGPTTQPSAPPGYTHTALVGCGRARVVVDSAVCCGRRVARWVRG
jgi:hypothetical protein